MCIMLTDDLANGLWILTFLILSTTSFSVARLVSDAIAYTALVPQTVHNNAICPSFADVMEVARPSVGGPALLL